MKSLSLSVLLVLFYLNNQTLIFTNSKRLEQRVFVKGLALKQLVQHHFKFYVKTVNVNMLTGDEITTADVR